MMYNPTQVNFNCYDDKTINVEINNEEYDICHEYSFKRGCNKKTGNYGKGINNELCDTRKVERTGLLGEMAFSKLFNIPLNLEYFENGDEYDFKLPNNCTIDIKTSMRNYNSGLIIAVSENGYKYKLKCNIYVFAYVKTESREHRNALITFVGIKCRNDIIKMEYSPALKGKHLNYQIPYANLIPMTKFLKTYNKLFNKNIIDIK